MPALGSGLDPSDLTACFAEIDTDDSGTLNVDEVHAFFGPRLGMSKDNVCKLLWDMDQNGDGEVDIEELRTALTARSTFSKRASMEETGELFEAIVGAVVPASSNEGFSDLIRPVLVDFDFSPGGLGRSCNERLAPPAAGCLIESVENRGIRLSALRAVPRHLRRRCVTEAWVSTHGMTLTPGSVNWYDAIAYVIKPATESAQCSYAEHVSAAATPPSWFCSHWWGGAPRP